MGRNVDTAVLEAYLPDEPLPPIYPGSIVTKCQDCRCEVYVGPRGQQALEDHPHATEVLCVLCTVKAQAPGVRPLMINLGNPFVRATRPPR